MVGNLCSNKNCNHGYITFNGVLMSNCEYLATKGDKTEWSRQNCIRVSIDEQYWKELEAYYSLAWYKRLFKRLPKGKTE